MSLVVALRVSLSLSLSLSLSVSLSLLDSPLQTTSAAWPLIRLPVQGGCVHYRRIHRVWCETPANLTSTTLAMCSAETERERERERENVPFNNYTDESARRARDTNRRKFRERGIHRERWRCPMKGIIRKFKEFWSTCAQDQSIEGRSMTEEELIIQTHLCTS